MSACTHNDHGHLVLWIVVSLIAFNSSCVDCSGERTRQENKIRDLEYKVQQLEQRR